MFQLFRSHAAASSAAPAVASPEATLDQARLVSALADIAARRALDVATLPPPVAEALKALDHAMAHCDEQSLISTVSFSIQASEAMAATARATGNVRAADRRAQAMASGVTELTHSIDEISSTANAFSAALHEAQAAVKTGADQTTRTCEASRLIGERFAHMSVVAAELSQAAEQIRTFVGSIEAIAQQTNLLALNATIEAARAGEAGKGFAVVASEVKTLSGQTQKATEDIRTRIGTLDHHVREMTEGVTTVQKLVDESIELSTGASHQIGAVRDVIEHNAERMDQIAAVLTQQSHAVEEISAGVSQVAQISGEAASNIDEVIRSVGASEKLIESLFAHLETRNVPHYVLHRAKSDHCLWKKRLSEMLVGLKSLKADELSDHHHCRLGKWYGSVSDPVIRSHPAFAALLAPHERVHNGGREAARLFAAGDLAGASQAVDAMNGASSEVLAGLDRLLASV